MSCIHCQDRIERKLKNTEGVESVSVSYLSEKASVSYDTSRIDFDAITGAVEELHYTVGRTSSPAAGAAAAALIIAALYMLLRVLMPASLASAFPLARSGMGYGMLFVIGLVTSFHCAAMCGGINLSQTLRAGVQAERGTKVLGILKPGILYNGGRIVSYTIIGIIVGALGSLVTVSGRFQGIVQIAAGIFMAIMGINMLGIFPALRRVNIHLPKIFGQVIDKQKAAGRGPLFIGLLNGLMPCGPLQAMQLYALSTGSPIAGGVSMFLFSAGTVPLMFGIGALSSALSGASFGRAIVPRVMKAGAILVTVMGLMMFSYGWSLGGLPGPAEAFAALSGTRKDGAAFVPVVENGVQLINSTLGPGRYPAIIVQQGIPVKWTINAPAGSINGCNNRMIIREYGVEHRFTPGENIIEFIPDRTGRFSYSCWMGMIRSSITVVGEGQIVENLENNDAPVPAGIAVLTDTAAVAEIGEQDGIRFQTVTTHLSDDGFSPALIILQNRLPLIWTINNDSLDPGNSRLVFPAFYTRLDIRQGDNRIQLTPTDDFDFSTADNIFYGYVKVVDDIQSADIDAIKAEVAEYETLMYPDSYFETAPAAGCACCGG